MVHSGDADAAQSSLQHCLDQCPSHADAHLLMAQIHLLQGNFTLCSQSLELCLSHNFEVRSLSMWTVLLAAKCLRDECAFMLLVDPRQMCKYIADLPPSSVTFRKHVSVSSVRHSNAEKDVCERKKKVASGKYTLSPQGGTLKILSAVTRYQHVLLKMFGVWRRQVWAH